VLSGAANSENSLVTASFLEEKPDENFLLVGWKMLKPSKRVHITGEMSWLL
jgi:hypothetical protein